jgi:signal transduction histidine kinase
MNILVADDDPAVRLILGKTLKQLGHTVTECSSGDEAFSILTAANPPRIAILDWLMPGMTGVEICEHLRAKNSTPLIYCLLLTSRNSKEDLLHALTHGAHDFQSKPIDLAELQARLTVGQRLVEAEDQIQRYSEQMEHLAESRAHQLQHAERLAAIGTLAAGVAHEINNPLSHIMGDAQTFQLIWDRLQPTLKAIEPDEAQAEMLNFALEETPQIIESITQGSRRIQTIVKSIRNHVRKDTATTHKPTDINECLENALTLCDNKLKYHFTILRKLSPDLPKVPAHPHQVEQIFINLLINAADAMGEDGGNITLVSRLVDDYVEVTLTDNGPGIPAEAIEKIWEPFYTTKAASAGTGLGLSIIKGIAESHHGSIKVCNVEPKGARFTIRLPLIPPITTEASD